MSQGEGGGQPLRIKSLEVLQEKIEEYFKDCDTTGRPYTMSGLAYALDIDRKTLLNYSKRTKYLPTIKKARNKVEFDVEQKLIKQGHAGIIFNLKNNFGWKDKQETELSGPGGEPLSNLISIKTSE